MRFCRMLLRTRGSISLGDRANVEKPACITTATLGNVPSHANAFAIMFSYPVIIPVL